MLICVDDRKVKCKNLSVKYAELSPGNFDPGSLTKKLPQYIAANVTQQIFLIFITECKLVGVLAQ